MARCVPDLPVALQPQVLEFRVRQHIIAEATKWFQCRYRDQYAQ
jgi:hypothetical protein